jgi:arabinose-5-phosphate isomerase
MAALHAGRRGGRGGLDTSPDALHAAGRLAGAAGAACIEVVGALPVEGVSAARMVALCPEAAPLVAAGAALGGGSAAGGKGEPQQRGAAAAYAASLAADARALGALPAAPPPRALAAFTAAAAAARGGGGGAVWTTGVGKAGLVAARFAASLRSLGLRGGYVTAPEWAHGDLGALRAGDAVVAFSHSGATAEVVAAAALAARAGAAVFAVTGGSEGAPLRAAAAGGVFAAPAAGELLGAVPTRSVCAQEAVANALLSAVAEHAGVTKNEFKGWHPGGALGAAPIRA